MMYCFRKSMIIVSKDICQLTKDLFRQPGKQHQMWLDDKGGCKKWCETFDRFGSGRTLSSSMSLYCSIECVPVTLSHKVHQLKMLELLLHVVWNVILPSLPCSHDLSSVLYALFLDSCSALCHLGTFEKGALIELDGETPCKECERNLCCWQCNRVQFCTFGPGSFLVVLCLWAHALTYELEICYTLISSGFLVHGSVRMALQTCCFLHIVESKRLHCRNYQSVQRMRSLSYFQAVTLSKVSLLTFATSESFPPGAMV